MARHPLTAVPATRSSLPLLKIRRRIVVGALALAAASGMFSTAAWLTSGSDPVPPPSGPDQTAIALAQTVVEDFVAARNSAVPSVEDVNHDFSTIPGTTQAREPLEATNLTFTEAAPMTLGDGTRAAQVATVQERFTVTIDGQLYDITVPMVKAGDGGWLLGAQPAIMPSRTAPDQGTEGLDYGDLYASLDAGELPGAYREQIATWARTFAHAGRADRNLYLLVGDEQDRDYSGLGGWELVGEPQIESFAPVPAPDPGFIVRVALVLRSPASNGPTLSTEYDVYLRSDKSQSQPPVVAWGAVGSYRTLTPYMNADQH